MEKLNVAIVGHGFVGKAVDAGFDDDYCTKFIVDPNYHTHVSDMPTTFPDVTFVCVPTPMGDDGSIDASIVDSTLFYLLENVSGLVVLKSTVTPSIIKNYEHYENFVYNPEFLTERNAEYDFKHPFMHVFGGRPHQTQKLYSYYKDYSLCEDCDIHSVTPMEASFIKYGINSFLATKVTWFNQFYDLVETFDCNYDKVVSAIGTDKRVAESHTKVPGPDGRFGYSGSCFPKDTTAIYAFSKYYCELTILKEAIKANNKIQSQYELGEREKEQHVRFDLDLD